MIKNILRTLVFTTLALYFAQLMLQSFYFDGSYKTILLLLLGLFLFNMFVRSVFQIISLPDRGILFFILYFLLTLTLMYISTAFIPTFAFNNLDLSTFFIVGVMLPSTKLSAFWSAVISAFVFSVLFRFFSWLSSKK